MNTINTRSCKNKKFILEAKKLAEEMLLISEHGIACCEDDGCFVIYGVIRDCGYKIRRTVDAEQFEELCKGNNSQLVH